MDRRGAALILVTVLLVVLTILSTALISSSFSENGFARRYLESTQAFWLAEAGMNQALNELKINPTLQFIDNTKLGQIGGYSATVDSTGLINLNGNINVTAYGFVPFNGPRVERGIQVIINRTTFTPNNFYNDTVLYSTGDVVIKNNAFEINGNVIYGDNLTVRETDNIHGNSTQVTNATLPALNFEQLKYISRQQGYYYNGTASVPPFPTEFWNDQAAQIPNVFFWDNTSPLTLKGTVGGLFIVGGGDVTTDIRIIGNVIVRGCIYTTGQFKIDGGGSALNIDGSILASNATINGGGNLSYNQTYMLTMQDWSSNATVTVTSWKDMNNTYTLY